MQTNQTPEALAGEIKRLARHYAACERDDERNGSWGPVTGADCASSELFAAIDRLRDMAASGAKDAERLDWLEARRLEGIAKGYKWDTWGYDTDRPVRDQLAAAIAATKRGGA